MAQERQRLFTAKEVGASLEAIFRQEKGKAVEKEGLIVEGMRALASGDVAQFVALLRVAEPEGSHRSRRIGIPRRIIGKYEGEAGQLMIDGDHFRAMERLVTAAKIAKELGDAPATRRLSLKAVEAYDALAKGLKEKGAVREAVIFCALAEEFATEMLGNSDLTRRIKDEYEALRKEMQGE